MGIITRMSPEFLSLEYCLFALASFTAERVDPGAVRDAKLQEMLRALLTNC